MEYISFSAHVDFVQNKGFIDGVQVRGAALFAVGCAGVLVGLGSAEGGVRLTHLCKPTQTSAR